VSQIRFQVSNMTADLFAPGPGDELVGIGVASPKLVSLASVRRRLKRVPPGAFVSAHVPYSDAFADTLRELGFLMVLMLRDPRDVAVSGAEYISSRQGHHLGKAFGSLDSDGRLLASIRGLALGELSDLRTRVSSMMGWRGETLTTTIRFEDLVGPQGGGTAESQEKGVAQIAGHLGVHMTPSQIENVASQLHGGTPTFRRGRTGDWEQAFGITHRAAAGPMIGDLLRDLGYERDDAWWSIPQEGAAQ
jgi:hypothetical protein